MALKYEKSQIKVRGTLPNLLHMPYKINKSAHLEKGLSSSKKLHADDDSK